MERVRALLGCFLGSSYEEISNQETFSTFDAVAKGSVSEVVDRSAFQHAVTLLTHFHWTLSVSLEGQDSPHSISSDDAAKSEHFLSELAYGVALSAGATLKLHIAKPPGTQDVDVFNPTVFFAWIAGLEIPEALSRFNELVARQPLVSFLHPSFDGSAATHAFRFASSGVSTPVPSAIAANKSELIAARREQIVSDWDALSLLPNDFRWMAQPRIKELEVTFAKLENFLGVLSLVDSTTSTAGGFLVRVKSHVVREQVLSWLEVPAKPDVALRHLFEWCYLTGGAGPLPDKLGLVRNFISLYWEFGIFGQDLRVVAAVRSGYSLYLKRNLKEFVELRAKVAAFILEVDGKAAKAVETVMGNLEKNFYGVATFMTSVVLIKVLQDKTFAGAFTSQLAVLGAALILISAIHALFARASALKEMERARELYDDLRQLYSAFFSLSDFDVIFKSGSQSPIEKTESYVRSRLFNLMLVWFGTLLIAGAVIYVLLKWN